MSCHHAAQTSFILFVVSYHSCRTGTVRYGCTVQVKFEYCTVQDLLSDLLTSRYQFRAQSNDEILMSNGGHVRLIFI